jgi:hypothetical protein
MGIHCTLVNSLPAEGIVLGHRDHLPDTLLPGPKLLLVCLVADVTRHPFAQLHVFQNPTDPALARPSDVWPSGYIPHWPETDIVPRDRARGDQFANVSYYGLEERLAPELRTAAWHSYVQGLGLRWRIMSRDRWNDYSDTDAVVAVRRFGVRPHYQFPASKLYNAWLAGVPAILGAENAYRAARISDLDFIEVVTVEELQRTLRRLQRCTEKRRAIMANARVRANQLTVPNIANLWQELLGRVVVPNYEKWRSLSAADQRRFLRRRILAYRYYQLQEMMRRIPNARGTVKAVITRTLRRG